VNHLSDEQLITGCAGGDRRYMDVLVSRYHSRLLDFAFRHLYDREAAADIAQTTLIRTFEFAGRYRTQGSFRKWLYTIALNLIRDECRRRQVRKETLFSAWGDADDSEDKGKSPEDTALDRVLGSKVWVAVESLSDNQQTAIILRFRHDLKYEEIAKVMEAPEGTVKSWIHHGLRRLREMLNPAGSEG
jgi:RNA polymerase sigma factor (sigma-70 family)